MKVFVVEESLALSTRLLERLKVVPGLIIVGLASTLSDAIRDIDTLSPDVVITDTEMGGGKGLALLHVLQARRNLEGTGPRVLGWTGCQDPRRQAVASGLGAEARFDKARDVERLVEYCRHTTP